MISFSCLVRSIQQFCNGKSNRNEGTLHVLIEIVPVACNGVHANESTCELDWTSLDYVHPPHPRVSSKSARRRHRLVFFRAAPSTPVFFPSFPVLILQRPAHPRDSPFSPPPLGDFLQALSPEQTTGLSKHVICMRGGCIRNLRECLSSPLARRRFEEITVVEVG